MQEKALYNSFHYRLGKTTGLKELWQELQQDASEAEQREFVKMMTANKPGILPSDAVEFKKRIIKRRTQATTGAWITFKAAADKDGEDLVKETINNKSVQTRFNPRLSKDTKLEWPYYLEIAKEKETWENSEMVQGEQNQKKEAEEGGAVEKFEKEFEGRWATTGSRCAGGGPPPAQGQVLEVEDDEEPEKKNKESERDAVAMSNLQKAHSLWDKSKRLWEGTLLKSAAHENTNGCRFEAVLKAAIVALDKVDSKNMEMEQKHLTGHKLTDDELKEAASRTTQLVKEIKEGNKKKTELNRWMGL